MNWVSSNYTAAPLTGGRNSRRVPSCISNRYNFSNSSGIPLCWMEDIHWLDNNDHIWHVILRIFCTYSNKKPASQRPSTGPIDCNQPRWHNLFHLRFCGSEYNAGNECNLNKTAFKYINTDNVIILLFLWIETQLLHYHNIVFHITLWESIEKIQIDFLQLFFIYRRSPMQIECAKGKGFGIELHINAWNNALSNHWKSIFIFN